MMIESRELSKVLFGIKQNVQGLVAKSSNGQQRTMLEIQIGTIDKLMLAIHQMEKQGEANMEKFKFLMMDEVSAVENFRSNVETEELVKEINAAAKLLKPGQKVPINSDSMAPTTFYNKLWTLRKENKIPEDIVPKQEKGKVYLARLSTKKVAES